MGRSPRLEFDGGVYHLIQRGNNKEFIFNKDVHKKSFYNIVRKSKEIMDFEIYGYVIMSNHYHMVIRTHGTPLSKIMHRINLKYSRYYNYEQQRTGHVFQGRYKGIYVYDERYLLTLLRYVHQNPVKADICKNIYNYMWSSDYSYRRNINDQIVDIDVILNMFSDDRKTSIEEYKKFMDVSIFEEESEFEGRLILGEMAMTTKDDAPKEKIKRKTLDEILLEVSGDENIFNNIKSGSRHRELSKYKKMYVEKAMLANYKMKEIGLNIGISESAANKFSTWY